MSLLNHDPAGIDRSRKTQQNPSASTNEPSAIEHLRAKLALKEKLQYTMTEANYALLSKDDEALRSLGFSKSQIAKLKEPGPSGQTGYPDNVISSNRAAIRRLKAQIEELSEARALERRTEWVGPVQIITDPRAKILQLIFPECPGDFIRHDLKSSGFRWSPSEGAWQRFISTQATYHALRIAQLYKDLCDPTRVIQNPFKS